MGLKLDHLQMGQLVGDKETSKVEQNTCRHLAWRNNWNSQSTTSTQRFFLQRVVQSLFHLFHSVAHSKQQSDGQPTNRQHEGESELAVRRGATHVAAGRRYSHSCQEQGT